MDAPVKLLVKLTVAPALLVRLAKVTVEFTKATLFPPTVNALASPAAIVEWPLPSVRAPNVSLEATPAMTTALNCKVPVLSVIGAVALMRVELMNAPSAAAPAGKVAAVVLLLSNSSVAFWLTVKLVEFCAEPRPANVNLPLVNAALATPLLTVVTPA